jgi:nitrogen regulatory protein P-II 1
MKGGRSSTFQDASPSPQGSPRQASFRWHANCSLYRARLVGVWTMKMIEAIIQPFKLEEVKQALNLIDVRGLTVSEVLGFGRQRGVPTQYRGTVSTPKFIPKVKLQVVVSDDNAAQAQEVIARAARTGKVGDGKIFVIPINDVIRIRTSEKGDSAL